MCVVFISNICEIILFSSFFCARSSPSSEIVFSVEVDFVASSARRHEIRIFPPHSPRNLSNIYAPSRIIRDLRATAVGNGFSNQARGNFGFASGSVNLIFTREKSIDDEDLIAAREPINASSEI